MPAFSQQTNTPDPQLRQQILAFVKKFDPAFNNNDPAALAPFYMEDAVLVVPEGLNLRSGGHREIFGQTCSRKCISATISAGSISIPLIS